eukprot:Awhi_evm2s7200
MFAKKYHRDSKTMLIKKFLFQSKLTNLNNENHCQNLLDHHQSTSISLLENKDFEIEMTDEDANDVDDANDIVEDDANDIVEDDAIDIDEEVNDIDEEVNEFDSLEEIFLEREKSLGYDQDLEGKMEVEVKGLVEIDDAEISDNGYYQDSEEDADDRFFIQYADLIKDDALFINTKFSKTSRKLFRNHLESSTKPKKHSSPKLVRLVEVPKVTQGHCRTETQVHPHNQSSYSGKFIRDYRAKNENYKKRQSVKTQNVIEQHSERYIKKPYPLHTWRCIYENFRSDCESPSKLPAYVYESDYERAIRNSLNSLDSDTNLNLTNQATGGLLDLMNREITPEDYDLLLMLDEGVQKKTCSKESIGNLPEIIYDKDGETEVLVCSICFDEFENESLTQLPCSHLYHTACITSWLSTHSQNCPLDQLSVF